MCFYYATVRARYSKARTFSHLGVGTSFPQSSISQELVSRPCRVDLVGDLGEENVGACAASAPGLRVCLAC